MSTETTPQPETAKPIYSNINPGDELRNGDEFRWNGEWRVVENPFKRHAIRGIVYRRPENIIAQFDQFEREEKRLKQPYIDKKWWPLHPIGGNKIYRDGERGYPIATFGNNFECQRAIDCHNACAGIPDPAAALAQLRNNQAELLLHLGNMLDEILTTKRGDWPRELYCVECDSNVSRKEAHAQSCKIGRANEVWDRISALAQDKPATEAKP